MATKNVRPVPLAQPAPQNRKTPNPEVQLRREEAATLVAELGSKKLESMTAPELLTWLHDNNRLGYGNLLRALFEITA
jgi:hypothetical protein